VNSTIRIKRGTGYADRFRYYKVILDGKEIGEIANGESKSFKVAPGTHILYLSIDYAKSNKLNFECKSNKTVSFECRNNISGVKYLLLPLYLTILANEYLILREVKM
jgi:hypothetical protein